MNKDYKLMAALIPLILVLIVPLYSTSESSGITNELPKVQLSNNSSANITNNTTSGIDYTANDISDSSTRRIYRTSQDNSNSDSESPTEDDSSSDETDTTDGATPEDV